MGKLDTLDYEGAKGFLLELDWLCISNELMCIAVLNLLLVLIFKNFITGTNKQSDLT
jgi:hypothetical protein